MNTATVWGRWRKTRQPAARERLLRHYAHVADLDTLATALEAYAGRPGAFPSFVRSRAGFEPLRPGQAEIDVAPIEIDVAPIALASARVDRNQWQRGLSAVLRAACRTAAREDLNQLVVSVEPGAVRLFGRCWSHAVSVVVPADTTDAATVSIARAGLRMRDWGHPGTLEFHPDRLVFTPVEGEAVSAVARPATFPDIDLDPVAGVLVSRVELLRVLDAAPDAVELRLCGQRLLVAGAELPTSYGTGAARLLLGRALLQEALKSAAGGEEVAIEALRGPGEPARISSDDDGYQMLLAQRLETPVLAQF